MSPKLKPGFWTEERVAILRRGRAEDWPARKIADLLGCTRNAVLGKADRLGLRESAHRGGGRVTAKREGAPAFPRGRSRFLRVPARQLAELEAAPSREPASRQIALIDLKAGECRWITGDDGRCCGHATALIAAGARHVASPYCGFHSERAYRPARENSKSAAPDPRHSASKTRGNALRASLRSAARRA
jgi:GcrA cell cycle regulator